MGSVPVGNAECFSGDAANHARARSYAGRVAGIAEVARRTSTTVAVVECRELVRCPQGHPALGFYERVPNGAAPGGHRSISRDREPAGRRGGAFERPGYMPGI